MIAELNAAGLEVTQDGNPGETLQIIVTDPHAGTTVTYNNDYHQGSTSVTTIEGNVETTDTVDGNGITTHTERNTESGEQTTTIVDPTNDTETTIVVDADGRRTETVVEALNDGEPIDYEVRPGDNLTEIAEAHGVTLEDLAESNPELFASPRDPDLINSGETVIIEEGTRTTVEVTFNGYTVTENPDGTVTVTNQEHGYEIDLEAGSLEADLADLLTAIDPDSSDPEEAREAEVVLNVLDGIFASEAIQQEGEGLDFEAVEELGEVSAATREAINEHGPGILVEPVMDQDGEVLDLYGARPEGVDADWVPVDWQGTVRWVHPDVAQALMADSETLATISELSAVIDLSNAQSDVYALDSDYTGAQSAAEDALRGVLNPYGYTIDLESPDGSLEEAQEALSEAQTLLDDATEVTNIYEEARSKLDEAIEANGKLEPLVAAPDPSAPDATAEDPNIHTDVYQQENYADSLAEHAEVEALFGAYNSLIAEGDLASIDLAILRNEQAGVDADSADHQNLLNLRELAKSRVELGQANADYLRAESDLRTFEADSARMMREMFDEWLDHNSSNGDDMYARAYVTADGQAMIDVYYDRGHYVEEYNTDRPMAHHSRHGQSIRLSVFDQDLNPEVSRNLPGSWIDESLNNAWNEHVATGVPDGRSLNTAWNEHPEGVPSEYEIFTHGHTFIATRENAAADLNELLASNAETALETLNGGLSDVQRQFESALAEHGTGTAELPEGAFPDGVEPVSVEWQGQTVMVSPDVKEQVEAGNLDAVIESGLPIQVQIDVTPDDGEYNPESRWVAPELALSALDLVAIKTEIGNLQTFRDQMNGIAAGQRDTAGDTSDYYMPNAVQDERLESDTENVLNADFQLQFQNLYQNGFDGAFHTQNGDGLEQTIQESLGLDTENEDHADILESVAEGIREFGGDAPEVSTIPIFYVDENGTSQTTLFGVRNDEGETTYVDITGKRFTDIEDFRHNNEQFSDDGRIVYANNLDMTPGEDGQIEIDADQARVLSAWESAVDPIVGIGTAVATVASFTPLAPVAAPVAIAGGTYLGTRAFINQKEHLNRGGDWTDTQSIMNVVSIATTTLPLASSALRLGGLVRAGIPRGTAFMASIGGSRATNAYADDIARYMQSGAASNRIAYGIDATTLTAAVPLVGVSGYDIVVHGGDMNGVQFANAVLNFGAGAFGAGMGIRGLTVRPGSGQTGVHGQKPQQETPGGLVPDGVIPPSGTSGRPAISVGDEGRPMVVHEQGSDGVYRPTDRMVFHDADHPVIEGESIAHVADDALQAGTGPHPGGGPEPHAPMTDEDSAPVADSGKVSLVHPTVESAHGLDTQHMQTREEAEIVLIYSALETGSGQKVANRDVDPHDTIQPVSESWGVAVRDIVPETHEVRITQVHENELVFFNPTNRQTFGRSQYDGTPPLKFEDGARVFHPGTNREYVYNAEQQRFEVLQPPADAPLYYNADANITLLRQPGGSFDLFGRGNNTDGIGTWKPSPRDVSHEASESSGWHYDESTNRTYKRNEDGELQRLAPENENGLIHYDKANKVTYLIVPHSGEVRFFGKGDNRVPQEAPSQGKRVRQTISNVVGDNRIGVAGRIKAPIPGDVATGPTISSMGRAVGTKTGMSKPNKSDRGWEFRNAPLSPLTGYSVQEAFQFKASTFQNEIDTVLAGYPEASPFRIEAVSWREIGAYAEDSNRTVVELSVSLGLQTGTATRLRPGERDFFGARRGLVHELTHGIPFNKVMSETKVSLPLWARLMILQKLGYDPAAMPAILVNPQELPPEVAVIALRPGFEDRPEIEIGGLPQGARVSEPFVQQVQAALGQSRIQVQLVTDNPAGLMRALQTNPDLASIHGLHDAEQSLIFVDGSVRSGMRLSRVKVAPERVHITDLTGQRRNVMNSSQMNLDVVFNRHPTVDHWLNRVSWPLKTRLRASGKLPRRLQPQPHYHPGEGFYRAIQHGNPKAARRETVSVTPLSIMRVLSGELRAAHKTRNNPKAVPQILSARHAQEFRPVTVTQPQGGETKVQVPNWLADVVNRGRTGHGVVWPKGGAKALTPLLDDWQAHPERSDSVREFRQNTLRTIEGMEGSHLSPSQVTAIIDFLSTQG
ncbi:LysM domain-containing protein [uncultured Nitratireductor sp.]|uniref:LysM peptidoglycan-binding domain-containing protein n=1 Tax=uncultured Nitratireductor sp. TaxID=520953 RepID=UPI0025E0C999|nr:LysM domain-containing protein [uncultured Nitratireductor sp.]